ncbi:hypothetical protein SD77_3027 [Bacillus badius]|uniref:Mobile element protein n=1 Tax=Bacillus badius TaxID=1455 RepID=A0ABR5ANY0_BACBA|nr:hypothetical protein SD77_3027 [Bacillus badius]
MTNSWTFKFFSFFLKKGLRKWLASRHNIYTNQFEEKVSLMRPFLFFLQSN